MSRVNKYWHKIYVPAGKMVLVVSLADQSKSELLGNTLNATISDGFVAVRLEGLENLTVSEDETKYQQSAAIASIGTMPPARVAAGIAEAIEARLERLWRLDEEELSILRNLRREVLKDVINTSGGKITSNSSPVSFAEIEGVGKEALEGS